MIFLIFFILFEFVLLNGELMNLAATTTYDHAISYNDRRGLEIVSATHCVDNFSGRSLDKIEVSEHISRKDIHLIIRRIECHRGGPRVEFEARLIDDIATIAVYRHKCSCRGGGHSTDVCEDKIGAITPTYEWRGE